MALKRKVVRTWIALCKNLPHLGLTHDENYVYRNGEYLCAGPGERITPGWAAYLGIEFGDEVRNFIYEQPKIENSEVKDE